MLLFFYNNNLYLWNKAEDIAVLAGFKDGRLLIPKAEWPAATSQNHTPPAERIPCGV